MKLKMPVKSTKKDLAKHKVIEKRVQDEGVRLEHPQGKERFDDVVRRAKKS